MLSEQFDGTKVDMENPDDPAIPTSKVTGSGIDLGFGFYYTHGKWYAALSMLHATNPKVDLGERQTFSIDKTYYFTFGHNINLRNPFYMIEPSILARTDGTSPPRLNPMASISAEAAIVIASPILFIFVSR